MSTSTANRPVAARINVHESSDYPIILGESLKGDSPSQSQYLRLRHNWEPRQGFSSQTGTLKRSNGQTQLAYKDDKTGSPTYDYRATAFKATENDEADRATQFALIFDPKKSAYILEQITQSFDLNLTSAHDQTSSEVKQHRQINLSRVGDHASIATGTNPSVEQDDDEPDAANPFDFRHFLSEAREYAEKATTLPGSRTPLPGSRTPLSGVPSPSLTAGRVISTSTPQFRSTPASGPLSKKPLVSRSTTSTTSKRPTVAKRKPAATKPSASQPLSSEVVSDSSDEDTQSTVPISRPSTSQTKEHGHNRNTSAASMGRSPNIVVTSGDLEIDMGSPIHEPSRRVALDLDAFRSQTQTPTLPLNSSRPPAAFSHHDIEMRDRSDDEDEDVDEDDHEAEADRSADMDDDVDELALDSPMREKEDERREEMEKAPTPPTPSAPPAVDDDEEDFLAAELAKELGQDDDAAQSANVYDDDESEISEEE